MSPHTERKIKCFLRFHFPSRYFDPLRNLYVANPENNELGIHKVRKNIIISHSGQMSSRNKFEVYSKECRRDEKTNFLNH